MIPSTVQAKHNLQESKIKGSSSGVALKGLSSTSTLKKELEESSPTKTKEAAKNSRLVRALSELKLFTISIINPVA